MIKNLVFIKELIFFIFLNSDLKNKEFYILKRDASKDVQEHLNYNLFLLHSGKC